MIQETLPKPKFYHNKQVIKPSIEQSLLNLYAMQLQQPVRGKMTLLNEKIEDGETIEEIVSSDEDDCIVLEPVVPKIYLEDEDDSSDETQSNNDLDNVPSDNIPTTSRFAVHKRDKPFAADKGPSSFVVDKKPSRFALDKNPCHSTVDKDTSCVGLDKDFRYFLEDKRPTVTAWDRNRETKLSLGLNYPIKVASMTSHDCIVIDDSFDQSQRDDSPVRVVDDRKIINKQETPTSKYNDSVILLDDTKGNDDFISLPSDEGEPKRKVKKVIDKPKRTPKIVRQRMHNSLFTKTERKKLEVYNSNTYNPGTIASDLAITNKRPIIIDGSNVAYSHGCMNVFSTEGIKYCIDYFEMMGHNVKAVVPMFRKATHKTTNSALLEQLQKENKIVFTPCKQLPNFSSTCYDDRFILQLAYERNAAVVSNDNYRDLIHENPAFKKIIENRVIGYSWCDNILILPKDPYGRFGPALSQILHC